MHLQLAQLNVATLRRPLDHADSAGFAEGLPPVNAAGEAAAGFVWRLQTDGGDATSIRAFPDPLTIVNLSVWESEQALRDFAYSGTHRDYLRRRGEWFEPTSRSVLWWVPAGTTPTIDDATQRLHFLERFGPSPFAFKMGQQHPTLVVLRRTLTHPDVQSMIARLDAELHAATPPGGSNFFHIADEHVQEGRGAFFVAYVDGQPSACGAFRRIDHHAAEVKRMWTDPDRRGLRLAAAVLATIESAARASGFAELRLETGDYLTPALALYRSFGFTPCEPWGEYLGVESSMCLRKSVA